MLKYIKKIIISFMNENNGKLNFALRFFGFIICF